MILTAWIDESEKGGFLGVGGFYTSVETLPSILRGWRQMKLHLGLPEDAEIKWVIAQKDRTRRLLRTRTATTQDVNNASISFICARNDITCLAAVMTERRSMGTWKEIWDAASVRDFYCEGLRYLLQRIAEEVELTTIDHTIIVLDTPSLGRVEFLRDKLARGPRAVFKRYKAYCSDGVGVGPSKLVSHKALDDLGFHPSLLLSDATYHDLLQIADVVVGCATSWAKDTADGKKGSFATICMRKLSCRFRSRYGSRGGLWGDGFILHPSDIDLWRSLQSSLAGPTQTHSD